MSPQLWRDVLVIRHYQGWRRALLWASHTLWNDLRWRQR